MSILENRYAEITQNRPIDFFHSSLVFNYETRGKSIHGVTLIYIQYKENPHTSPHNSLDETKRQTNQTPCANAFLQRAIQYPLPLSPHRPPPLPPPYPTTPNPLLSSSPHLVAAGSHLPVNPGQLLAGSVRVLISALVNALHALPPPV